MFIRMKVVAIVLLVGLACQLQAFNSPWRRPGFRRTSLRVTVPDPSTDPDGSSRGGVPPIDLNEDDPEYEKKMAALDLLDVLTCTDDEDDPEYDVSKDIRRDKLILNNDYHDLKIQLRKKGLRTGGDKEEMIARLLLHIIDPSIDYMEATGRESTLSYVDESDIESGKVALVPEGQRNQQGYDFNGRPSMRKDEEEDENASIFTRQVANDLGRIDAEDVQVLRPRKILTSANNEVGGGTNVPQTSVDAVGKGDQVMMDGLTRQEIVFKPIQISRDATQALREDGKGGEISGDSAATGGEAQLSPYIRGYLVGGRDVLRTWERNPTVVVLLPDVLTTEPLPSSADSSVGREEREREGGGWRSRGVRVLADEIAFNMQCIVIVPDLARGLEGVEVEQASAADSGTEEDEDEDGCVGSGSLEGTKNCATRKRLFDDIASTIAFAKTEYDSESVCLAGLRSGAGLALEASCDLYNMACLSQIYAMDDFQGAGEEDGAGDDSGGRAKHWNMCGGLWQQQARMAPQPPQSLKYYRALAEQGASEFSYLDDYFAAEEGSLFDDGDWVGGAGWADDLGADEAEDEDIDLSEAELELMAENMLAELAREEGVDGIVEEEEEPQVIEGHVSAYFDGSVSQGASEEEEGRVKVSDAEVQAAIQKASAGSQCATAAGVISADASEERERLLALMEGERTEIAALVRRADEVAATNALTRNTLSSSSMLTLDSIPSLLPRALFLVDPSMYDQKRVQQELRLPSFFVYGCNDDATEKRRLGSGDHEAHTNDESVRGSDRADLLFSLKKRRHEVVDFCIRQYEGVSGKFLSEPVTPEDAVCGQEAIVIGSAWLDIYGRKLAATRVYETGENGPDLAMDENDGNDGDRDSENKGIADMGYSEGSQVLAQTKFDTPFVRISANELGGTTRITELMRQAEEEARASGESEEVKKAFKRPSPIATFLHDDDQLYRDQPKDGWEFTQSV